MSRHSRGRGRLLAGFCDGAGNWFWSSDDGTNDCYDAIIVFVIAAAAVIASATVATVTAVVATAAISIAIIRLIIITWFQGHD